MSNIKVGDTVIIRKPEYFVTSRVGLQGIMQSLDGKKRIVKKINENGEIFVKRGWRLDPSWCEKVKPKKSKKKIIKKLKKKIKMLEHDKTLLESKLIEAGDIIKTYRGMLRLL